ncbi:hypothetical protein NA56DRAFT_651812 [Hyaloscypha hepaticicola]|uniref:Uncharacterized protein n=1 Tax=Hyaloscypha hepaticicola TaxID=2082293 RepID=A0A2J6PH49_9HELO|nr:hypothetical protein NA56DRAFT_651812 [Hyaloscypha hepaticicola]
MRRWLPFVAHFWCAAVIILALHTLLAGYNNDTLEGVAIITFNTSSLGLSDFHQSNSTLQPAVEALVPSSLTNPTSITQYLGIKDWYSSHYLSTCSGSFQPSTTNPNVLTSNKINSTCVRRNAGYAFTISNILREELHPSVVGIADEVTQASYYTASWIALWLIGIVAAVVEMFIFLPLTWYGTRRLNGYSTLVSFISYISFQVASSLAAGHSLKAYHSKTLPSALYAEEFYVMSFTTMALMFVVFFLIHIEWRFELWTFRGEPITIYRKPECKSWSILSAFWDRNPTKIEAAGRDEEYEMR